MNKLDVIYKNFKYPFIKDIFQNCDLSLLNTDGRISKILTNSSFKKHLDKKCKKQQPTNYRNDPVGETSTTSSNLFKNHPRNFTDDEQLSTDSIDSITTDYILQTKFQQHKDSIKQIRNQFSNIPTNTHIWNERHTLPNIVKGVRKTTKPKKVPAPAEVSSDNQMGKKVKSTSKVQKTPKQRSIVKANEHAGKLTKKLIKPEPNNNTYKIVDDLLGINLISYLKKISNASADLCNVIYAGSNPIDGAEDYVLRETRCKEFAARFARLYDYELSRLLGLLKSLIPRVTNRASVDRIAQHITKSFQIILQAFAQYSTHIPTTIISIEKKQNNIHHKFNSLLRNSVDFFIVVRNTEKTFVDVRSCVDMIEDTVQNFNMLIDLIEEKFLKQATIVKSQPKPKKVTLKEKKSPYEIPLQNKSMEARLSMYAMTNKTKSERNLLAKRKNVQSRYKTAGITKPAVVEKASDKEKKDLEKKKLLAQKRSSQIIGASYSTLDPPHFNEDDIETMVEKVARTAQSTFKTEISTESNDLRSKVATLLQSWTDSHTKKDSRTHKDMIVEQMVNLIEQAKDSEKTKSQNSFMETSTLKSDAPDAKEKHSLVELTNNAKLILVKDQSTYGSTTNTTISLDPDHELLKLKISSSKSILPSTIMLDSEKTFLTPITNRPLSKELEQSFINILTYRKNFKNFTGNNPILKKMKIYPWQLTSMISEELLSDTLTSVLSEINLSNVAENVYATEFD